jgi:hypothetical protein
MITKLSDLYTTISTRLPGVSTSILDNEFRQAEREACRDASIWLKELTFTIPSPLPSPVVYAHSTTLPANTDLVYVDKLQNADENDVSLSDWVAVFQAATSGDGYSIQAETEGTPTGIEGDYTDSGGSLNGKTVYTDASDSYALYKAVAGVDEASSLYILSSKTEYVAFAVDSTDFPENFFAVEPPSSAFTGLLLSNGSWTGQLRSTGFDSRAEVEFTLKDYLVDNHAGDTYTAKVALMPRIGFSTAPDEVLTQYADLITAIALRRLLSYPAKFPWADPQEAINAATEVRRLKSKAKQDYYRPNKRTSIAMRQRSFI